MDLRVAMKKEIRKDKVSLSPGEQAHNRGINGSIEYKTLEQVSRRWGTVTSISSNIAFF